MRCFIESILQTNKVTSLSWIHDGIWVAPSPSASSRTEATRIANKTLHALLFGCTSFVSHFSIAIGFLNLNGARDAIIKFIKVGAPNDALRPGPAESQEAVELCVHEYDYGLVEQPAAGEVRLHADKVMGHTGKRKLPCQDSSNTINKYFKRQSIIPT